MIDAADIMKSAMARYREKGNIYGHTYRDYGGLLTALFPNGLAIFTEEDWNSLGILQMICHKLLRVANMWVDDRKKECCEELEDMGVYTFMLLEIIQNDSMGHGDNGADRAGSETPH